MPLYLYIARHTMNAQVMHTGGVTRSRVCMWPSLCSGTLLCCAVFAHTITFVSAQYTGMNIAAGDVHSCALLDSGQALCFGYGLFGQLGSDATAYIGNDPSRPTASGIVQLPVNRTALSISAGGDHTCVVLDTGQALCFGHGADGQLGSDATANKPELAPQVHSTRSHQAISTHP